MKRPTLQAIADLAGVSKMTVSRVLRNHPNCSGETSARVKAIAKELNYKKHPLVSALMSDLRYKKEPKFKSIIALLHFDQRRTHLHPNLVNMRRGVRETAGMQGYDVEEFYLKDHGISLKRMLQIFNTRGIRGIIFEHSAQTEIHLEVDLSEFACVATKYSLVQPVLNRIETSQFSSFLLAVDKLKEYGYQRFGLVVPTYSENISQFRRTGAMLYAQHTFPEENRIPILETHSLEKQAIKSWLKKYTPDVILAKAIDVYKMLIRLGYRIPEDFGFIHLDISTRDDRISGINPNWAEMGRNAANQIIDQLNRNEVGVPKHPIVTLIQGDWIDGATLPRRSIEAVSREQRA